MMCMVLVCLHEKCGKLQRLLFAGRFTAIVLTCSRVYLFVYWNAYCGIHAVLIIAQVRIPLPCYLTATVDLRKAY